MEHTVPVRLGNVINSVRLLFNIIMKFKKNWRWPNHWNITQNMDNINTRLIPKCVRQYESIVPSNFLFRYILPFVHRCNIYYCKFWYPITIVWRPIIADLRVFFFFLIVKCSINRTAEWNRIINRFYFMLLFILILKMCARSSSIYVMITIYTTYTHIFTFN